MFHDVLDGIGLMWLIPLNKRGPVLKYTTRWWVNTFSDQAIPEIDQKIIEEIWKSQTSQRRLDGLPGRFRLKIEHIQNCTRPFCPKPREMP